MTLLDLSLLGLLADQPLHGYELSKQLRELGRGSVSYGALYPALARLDRKGFVTTAAATTEPPPDTAPMTGSLGAEVARLRRGTPARAQRPTRRRKVYTITEPGRAYLHDLLTRPAEDDRTFAAQFAAAGHLTRTERVDLLEHRRHALRARLAQDHPREADRYRSALRDRDRLSDEAEIEWLDHLIAAERDTQIPHPVDDPVERSPRTVGGSVS
ncbi:MAG: PadR family transcriptional regulator [Actinobacteria bacterium]|nr:PadR family transcriptional regulator [Actinomycetota bacterium]